MAAPCARPSRLGLGRARAASSVEWARRGPCLSGWPLRRAPGQAPVNLPKAAAARDGLPFLDSA